MRVAIAPGHLPLYKGVYKNGYYEYDQTKIIADLLVENLATSHEVFLVEGSLEDKVTRINDLMCDLALEIHLGNSNNANTGGSRSFYTIANAQSQPFAEHMLNACVRYLGTANRGSYVGWWKHISPTLVREGRASLNWKPKIDLFLQKINTTTCLIEPFYL